MTSTVSNDKLVARESGNICSLRFGDGSNTSTTRYSVVVSGQRLRATADITALLLSNSEQTIAASVDLPPC